MDVLLAQVEQIGRLGLVVLRRLTARLLGLILAALSRLLFHFRLSTCYTGASWLYGK